jgi:predicted transcriptional regulator
MPDLKTRREALRLTRRQVAERVGITESALYRIEVGQRKPLDVTRKAIERVLEEAKKARKK